MNLIQSHRFRYRLAVAMSVVCISNAAIFAQSFVITGMETEGSKLNLYYSLIDQNESNRYAVRVFSSRDRFGTELKAVTGDVGFLITPGSNKKIIVDLETEFGYGIDGEISFQIRGTLYRPSYELKKEYTTVRRGKSYELEWSGGSETDSLGFKLIKEGKNVHDFVPIQNGFKRKFRLPGTTKFGSYQLLIFNIEQPEKMLLTGDFLVKRRIPTLAKILPLFGIGSALAYFLDSDPRDSYLPDPIKPK